MTQYLKQAKAFISGECKETNIRNICIIAHVDHGKTSLSDFLLASNKHVSLRQIEGGQKSGEAVRYLDSRLDEIDRQITIKSSCISLVHKDHLINLIDSPGHIDFAAEVSAAARLTDGAILVVDAVEGVRAQTCSVIKQAWENRIVPILLINKLDKLASLVESASEANNRIRQIVENINILFHDLLEAEKEELGLAAIPQTEIERYQFDPTRGNVLFGSALHGWAFDLNQYTDCLVRSKIEKNFGGQPIPDLVKYMYGEYALPMGKAHVNFSPVPVSPSFPTSLFTKFVIEQIWTLYRSDAGSAQLKLSQLFPVATSVLLSVVRHIPCPRDALSGREKLFFKHHNESGLKGSVGFVVKHQPADLVIGCLLGDRVDDIRKLNGFVSITRIFNGEISVGQTLFSNPDETICVSKMFMLMGSSLVPIDKAMAGCVVALQFDRELTDAGGVTLSSEPNFEPMLSPYSTAQAIVRVTAEVKKSIDEERLDEGLRLLSRSDPAVVISRHAQTGERIIGCCGDEHLARCIQDLEQLFAVGISILISPPIVEIRESIVSQFNETVDGETEEGSRPLPPWLSDFAPYVVSSGAVRVTSSDSTASVCVSAQPIPPQAMEWIVKWQPQLGQLFHERHVPIHLWLHLSSESRSFENCLKSVKEILASFGLPNVDDLYVKSEAVVNVLCGGEGVISESIRFGFQQACLSGPLAEEPVRGVCWTILDASVSEDHPSSALCATATACRAALLSGPVRISEPMLQIELQTENVKAAQTVLAGRRADIVFSDLVEGSYSEYLIRALIPASDAFKVGDKSKVSFSDELRGATHGKVVWRLSFSHWQVLADSNPLGPSNMVAHKLVCGVRKRKGLSVGEKVVADADKQRTLTKMK